MTRSFLTLRPTRPGFDASNKIVASMVLSGARYQTPAPRVAFLDDLTGRLALLPDVRGVSAISFAPFSGMLSFLPITVTGRPDVADGRVSVFTSAVTANYFDEMRMSIRRGRGFLPTDDGRAAPIAIVSETLARRVWPDGNAIGAEVSMTARAVDPTPRRVVGVVSDIRMFGSHTRPSSEIYVPMSQDPSVYLNVVVRTADAGMGELGPAIRRAAAAVDATQVLDAVRTFDDLLAGSVAGRRSITWLMSAFAVMAIGLAVVGLTAVIGASVAQQTREIGIRMTLGARPEAVVGLVLRQAMALALGGVVIGLGVAVATTRFLSGYLYGVTPLDRTTFALSAVLMFVVATAASYIPARRATKVDPLVALRAE
jgi:putative ABC transport system permease protein